MTKEGDERSVVKTNDSSFSVWYDSVFTSVVRSVAFATRDPSNAVDAANDAFLKAFERWDRVQAMDSPKAWVIRVALNQSKRHWRRRQVEQGSAQSLQSACRDLDERDIALWLAVSALPPRQREAVVLKYVADLSEREVAATLKISTGGASALLAKARESLRKSLESSHG